VKSDPAEKQSALRGDDRFLGRGATGESIVTAKSRLLFCEIGFPAIA